MKNIGLVIILAAGGWWLWKKSQATAQQQAQATQSANTINDVGGFIDGLTGGGIS